VLLRDLASRVLPDAVRVLGVTGVDLFIPMLSFVYGQAQVGGRTAVISSARLRPEFYGAHPVAARTIGRGITEAVHELGHTFGLLHCRDPHCPMSLSHTLIQVDAKGEELCVGCARLLDDYLTHNGLLPHAGGEAEN
jgi:archaemetzincin